MRKTLRDKILGVMVSVGPDHANFRHAVGLAAAALGRGVRVYFYCLDEGVRGLGQPALKELRERGLHLFACAYGAQKRGVPMDDAAAFSGLGMLSDIMEATDRFVSFN